MGADALASTFSPTASYQETIMTPKRIQRKRTKGWRMPPNTVNVTRPGPWGNPRRVGMYQGYGRADAVADFKRWLARDGACRSWEGVYGKPPTTKEIRKE